MSDLLDPFGCRMGDEIVKPILNLSDVPLVHQSHGDSFEASMGQVGAALGASLIGCRLTVVPPGKKAWPYHCHHANEEMFVILSGTADLRFGKEIFPVKNGDVVVCPPGGK